MRAVFTAADLNPGVHEQWYTSMGKDVPDTPRPPLAEGEVRHAGDPVALVVAVDRYVAEDAVDLVEVDYDAAAGRWSTTSSPAAPMTWCTSSTTANVAGSIGRPLSERLAAVFEAAAHDVAVSIHQQAYGAGADGDAGHGRRVVRRASSPSGRRPRRRTRCGCSSPGCSASASTRCG